MDREGPIVGPVARWGILARLLLRQWVLEHTGPYCPLFLEPLFPYFSRIRPDDLSDPED